MVQTLYKNSRKNYKAKKLKYKTVITAVIILNP